MLVYSGLLLDLNKSNHRLWEKHPVLQHDLLFMWDWESLYSMEESEHTQVKGSCIFQLLLWKFTLTKYQLLSAWIPVRLPYVSGRARSRSLFFRNQFLKKPLKCSLRTSLCAQGCSSHWLVTWAVLPQPQNAALVGVLIKRRQNEARRTQCCAHTTHWQLLHWEWRMRSFLPADPTAWEDGSFPSLRLKTGTLINWSKSIHSFCSGVYCGIFPVPLKYVSYFYSASLQQLLNTHRAVRWEKGMDLTWSYPGCDFNLHAKEKLSFGGI